jgi:hypothetical protein
MASGENSEVRCRITRQNSFSSRYERSKSGGWKGVAASMTSPVTRGTNSPERAPLSNVEAPPAEPALSSSKSMPPSEVRKRFEEDSDRRKEVMARASLLLSPTTAGSSWTGVSSALTPQGAPSDERPVRRRSKASSVDVSGWQSTVPVPPWMASSKENGGAQQAAIVGAAKEHSQRTHKVLEPADKASPEPPMDVPAIVAAEDASAPHVQSPKQSTDAMSGVGGLLAYQPDWVQAFVKATLCLCVKDA